MARTPKATSPPPTEVLSVTERTLTPEAGQELAEAESGNVQPPEVIGDGTVNKPVQEQISGSEGFTLDEGGEEVTHDPLTDTKRALHQKSQELSDLIMEHQKLKDTVNAIVADKQIADASANFRPPEPEPADIPEPGEEDYANPVGYIQKINLANQKLRQQERVQAEFEDFVEKNPDWRDSYPKMVEVANRFGVPTRRPLHRLLEQAKRETEIERLRAKLGEVQNEAMKAGANMERSKENQPFTATTGGVSARSEPTMPDMRGPEWTSGKILEWAKKHGRYKEL